MLRAQAVAVVTAAGFLLTPVVASAAQPVDSLNFLIGSWNCSFQMGAQRASYHAVYARAMGGAGILQTDSWRGGGGDAGLYTYDGTARQWNATFVEPSGQTTVFLSKDKGPQRIAYRSVYPDTTAREVFERVSPAKYLINFTQTKNGKVTVSNDVCSKTA